MVQKITGEAPFQVLATNFSISPSQQDYTLQISADGTNYSDLFTVSAGQTKMVTNVANGSYYRMKNNASEVSINWRTQCNDGQSGGGGSYILPPATQQTLGGIKVGSGLTVQADGTLSTNGGGGSVDNTILKSVTSFPQSAETGDVVALYETITFYERIMVPQTSISYDGDDILEITTDLGILTINTFEDNGTNVIKFTNGDEGVEEFIVIGGNNSVTLPTNDENYAWDAILKGGTLIIRVSDGVSSQPIFTEDSIVLNTCDAYLDIADGEQTELGLYQYDGSSWNEIGEYSDGMLYKWEGNYILPYNEFPADPVEGQITNYDDGQGNIGLYRYDGTDWVPFGGGEGVVYVTHLSDAEAAAAPVGSLIVLNNETTKYAEASWANNTLTLNYAGLEDETELEIARWEYYSAWFYLYATNGGFIIRKSRDGYESVDYSLTGDSGTVVLDNFSNRTNTLTYTNSGSQLTASFSNNIDNHYLINLPILNEHMIYIKVQGGEIAHWNGYNSSEQTEPFQIIYDDYDDFVNFADGKTLLSFKYKFNDTYRYIAVDKDEQAVVLYSDSALTTEVARAEYLGTEVQFASAYNNIYYVAVHWKEDEISFRCSSFVNAGNLLPFATEGVHYHRITDPTKATAQDLGLGNNFDSGIPEWNNEGVIVGKRNNYITKSVQFNYGSNSYTNNASIVAQSGENNIPSRMYVPTAGGTSGQVLISNGIDSAPTFQNWIKVVKITSDAYDALVQAGTTDPNTLYAIVDE